jgi:NAD(P)H-hydrate epimerase
MTDLPIRQLPALPPRPKNGHKGTFGKVCVIGGQSGGAAGVDMMIGGPALCALGALRSGCGLAVLAMPRNILAEGLTIAPSATGLALPQDRDGALVPSAIAELIDARMSTIDSFAIGPGFGAAHPQQQIVLRLLGQSDKPVVVDADAINALIQCPDFQRDLRAPAVFTPHPGEFARLADALAIEADAIEPQARIVAAAALAQRLGSVVVLKGHRTVISNGQDVFVNDTGGPALATGGTGDVLAGVIASMIAQFFKEHLGAGSRSLTSEARGGLDLMSCAMLGVHLHGLAADLWSRRRGSAGMLAMDLVDSLPDALQSLREGER